MEKRTLKQYIVTKEYRAITELSTQFGHEARIINMCENSLVNV